MFKNGKVKSINCFYKCSFKIEPIIINHSYVLLEYFAKVPFWFIAHKGESQFKQWELCTVMAVDVHFAQFSAYSPHFLWSVVLKMFHGEYVLKIVAYIIG